MGSIKVYTSFNKLCIKLSPLLDDSQILSFETVC